MVQEIKGDTVAPGMEGLLNLRPDDFVFYVGGYPSNFTVSGARPQGSVGEDQQSYLSYPWRPVSVSPLAVWVPTGLS